LWKPLLGGLLRLLLSDNRWSWRSLLALLTLLFSEDVLMMVTGSLVLPSRVQLVLGRVMH
jgi:hypothetical protein